MPITFQAGWDSEVNHSSLRSENEIRRIISEIPGLSENNLLEKDFSKDGSSSMSLDTMIVMNFPITVTKGIHTDTNGMHKP
jgi:hypothetical protein